MAVDLFDGCEGKPAIIGYEKEFEGTDELGKPMFSTVGVYNCEDCDENDCEYWKEFHVSMDEKEVESFIGGY